MKKTAISSVKNQEISHEIALILHAMSVKNMVTLSWAVHTRYLLQELQQLTTNLTEATMPDQVQGTNVKTEADKANPDHSLTFDDTSP